MSTVIEMTGIHKIYGAGSQTFQALRGIDLSIKRGELLAIIGSSGAGKSTLMNLIGLLDTPTSGTYQLNHTSVEHLNDDARSIIRNCEIGFVFQSFFLLPRLTILENIGLPLIYRGESEMNARSRAQGLLEKLHIERLAGQKPHQLSGGQQQRVAIARALIGGPSVILADEPTGALDSKTGEEVLQLFMQLNQEEHVTVIIVTHDKSVARQCHHIVEIEDGRIRT